VGCECVPFPKRVITVESRYYSSDSISPSVGLCFDSFFDCFRVGIFWTGGGEPISSLARDFTALAALNFFFLFFTACDYLAAPASDGSMFFRASSASDSA